MKTHAWPAALAMALAVSAAGGSAPQSRPGQTQQPPPSRDTSAQIRRGTGTASLSGQVVALDTGRGLKRARVSITAPELPDGRAVMTDQDGRFTVPNLPAGRYTIIASKPGFINLAYGARRPGRAGRPHRLGDGEQARGLDFHLPRGSVVTGHVFDEDGEPLIGAQVRAMRFAYVQGEKRLTPAGSGMTDDRGEFRIYGLQPGTYYVAGATTQGTAVTVMGRDGSFVVNGVNIPAAAADAGSQAAPSGFAPTYYPGVTSVADALPVTVGLQAEAGNVDFVLQLVPTARVSGMVTGPDGAPAAGGAVTLSPEDGSTVGRLLGANYSSGIRPDGSFAVLNVPPGRYIAFARGMGRRGEDSLFAIQPIAVAGSDVTSVNLALTTGLTISGAVSAETGSSTPGTLTRLRISLMPLSSLPIPTPPPSGVLVDGSFSITPVVAGSYLVRTSGLPQNFSLKGAYYGGRDVSDVPLEIRPGQNLGGLSLVISDRVTQLYGTVSDSSDQPLLDYTVVAFSSDASNWRPQSRYIQVGRPDANGQFRIRGLPPGEYLVVALDDVESGEWFDPAFLMAQKRSAVSISLGDGETKTIELKLATGR
ncbi:MAG: carboxypeptidase regulatory-like domain-containing protein [Acidobacteria bacterium]|nr:carboxypeptidase regulatory-like domain-containing protein [Acidobacteriota bacterium]